MTSQRTPDHRADRREPPWLVPVVVGTVMTVLLTWLGVNDWRVPWARGTSSDPIPTSSAPTNGPPSPAGTAEPTPIVRGKPATTPVPGSTLTLTVAPTILTNRGEVMEFEIAVAGGTPRSEVDIELPNLDPQAGGVCAEFSDAGCSLVLTEYVELRSDGSGSVSTSVYPCGLLGRRYDPASVVGRYAVWGKETASGDVTTVELEIENAADVPPVDRWQTNGCP